MMPTFTIPNMQSGSAVTISFYKGSVMKYLFVLTKENTPVPIDLRQALSRGVSSKADLVPKKAAK